MDKAILAQQNMELTKRNADLSEELALLQKNESLVQENARIAEQIALAKAAINPYGGMPPAAPTAIIRAPPGLPPPPVPVVPSLGMTFGVSPLVVCHDASSPRGRTKSHRSRAATSSSISSKSSMSSVSSVTSTCSTYSARSITSTVSSCILDEATKAKYDAWPTAVMMKNVPKNYTREQLLEIVDAAGFKNDYNIVSVPIDLQSEIGLGYAFVNFTTHEQAEQFKYHFHDFKEWHVPSSEPCEVMWSDTLKGYDSIIERYRNSPVMHESVADKFKPAIYSDGVRISFPEPTKIIKAPRLRRRERGGAGKFSMDSGKTVEAKEAEF